MSEVQDQLDVGIKFGDKGWRPSEVHPLAALFPPLSDDDLTALAEDIKANGLLHPIIIDADDRLIDGRMRLAACKQADVEPTYERLNGHDAEALIWSANGKRRHMSKGQMAMIAAWSLEPKEHGGNQWSDTGKAKAARAAGVSQARISQAILVRKFAPHLAEVVMRGDHSLDEAYAQAQRNEREAKWRDDGLRMLRQADRDLAQRVQDQELTLDDARGELNKRAQERHAMRDSVLLGISSFLTSGGGFDKSSALQALPDDLKHEEAREHLQQYFRGGIKEIGEKLDAARKGFAAVEAVYQQLSKSKGK